MSTEEVVKSVAKKLKYYFQVKRLEDGFDLSDVHQPLLSHPPLKARPAHQYDGLHDRALKHYFSQPEVKVMLTQLNSQPNASEGLHEWREIEIRKKLDNYMKCYTFKKRALRSCYYCHPNNAKPPVITGILHRRKRKQKSLSGGLPVLRTVPDQHISKVEANRLVNSAAKIICGSELSNPVYQLPKTNKKDTKQPSMRLFQTVLSRPTTARSRRELHKNQPTAHQKTEKTTRPESRQQSRQALSRSISPQSTRSSASSYTSTSSASLVSTSSSSSTFSHSTANKSSAEIQSPTVINIPEPQLKDEVGVMMSTQTAGDSDVDSKTGRYKADDEVIEGPECEYQVLVSTGDRIGASTMAPVKLILYGEKGRTNEFDLNRLSKRHKIPFQKGNEDLFLLPARHIGRLRTIQIGHDRAELNYAWFLDKVTVFDKHAKRIYQFPCGSWLSGQDQGKKTYRILHADSEREFMEALDVSMTKSALNEKDNPGSSNSAAEIEQTQKTKVNDNAGKNSKPQGSGNNSKDSIRIGSDRVDSGTSRYNQKGETQRKQEDDYTQRATKITLHSMPGSNIVEEIFLENGSITDSKIKQDMDFMENYQSPISEQEQKLQLERKRQAEGDLLKGKSIHNAVRDGDIDRVKDLLHHFPEMRDKKDDRGWRPIHLAAASGNMEILRWLVTGDADISAETPTGYTAVHLTAMNGHLNAMMILQAMGASIVSLTKEKQSVLHMAAKSGHLECVKWLVANRASLDTKDSFGNTAFRLAEENQHESCANFLRICMQELSNPKSSFAQLHGQRISGADLPPIKEDANSGSSGNARKNNIDVEVENKKIQADYNPQR